MSEPAPQDQQQEPAFIKRVGSASSEPDRIEIWAGRVGRLLAYGLALLMIGNLVQHFLS